MSALYISYREGLEVLPHIKIAYDLRVCHELDPGSVVQVQGHSSRKICHIVQDIIFLEFIPFVQDYPILNLKL